jgi:hypothetical protein
VPAFTVCVVGLMASEKSPAAGAFTTSVTVVECEGTPVPVPVMVRVYVPGVVLVLVGTESEELAAVFGLGLNVPVRPAGELLMLRVTPPVKPPLRVTLTV